MPQTGIGRDQIQGRPGHRRLGDVINRLPGIFMGGPPGENNDIRVRGLDKEFTRFEFDGLQLPGAGEKREFEINRLSSLIVGELRVIRNPSAEFESDGLAGRVVALPRPIPEHLTIELHGGAGGLDTIDGGRAEGGFLVGDRIGESFGFNLALDISRLPFEKEKGKTVFRSGALLRSEVEEERAPDLNHNVYLDAAWFYERGAIHVKPLVLGLEENRGKTKLTTQPGRNPAFEREEEEKGQRTLGMTVSHLHRIGEASSIESEVSYVRSEEEKDKTKQIPRFAGGTFVPDRREAEEEDKLDAFWQVKEKLTLPWELGVPQVFSAGLQLRFRERERDKEKLLIAANGTVTNGAGPKDNDGLDEDLYMGFLQNELLLTDRWTVVAGVRVEREELVSESGAGKEDDATFTDVNPSLHTLYKLTDGLSLRAAASRGVNRPKFDELAPFVDEKPDKFVIGNPQLEPARSWNFDVGADLALDPAFVGVNLFTKRVKGVIEEVDTRENIGAKDVFHVENVGDGWVRGIELEQRLDAGGLLSALDGLSLWANETWVDSELTDSKGVTRRFNQQPDWIASFGGEYRLAPTRTTFTAAAKYVDDIETEKAAGEREVEKARLSLDLGLRQEVTRRARIVFEAINVTDVGKEKDKVKGVETEHETEDTGRVFFLGFEAEF